MTLFGSVSIDSLSKSCARGVTAVDVRTEMRGTDASGSRVFRIAVYERCPGKGKKTGAGYRDGNW